ncbi:MAG: ACT domain-containing protein [Oscillospiraceae bacterium]|jgi:hypothetical protein|nr:ACT domain-containing protein [Oscillospiraceae bacterium]
MLIKQLSIFVENKSGHLADITGILAKNNVDIRALSIADTTDYGILRLIVSKPDVAVAALKKEAVTVSVTHVIAIEVKDAPGGMHKAVQVLSESGISIEYMYAFLNPREGMAFVILRVEDNEKAAKALETGGIRLMTEEELYNL